MLCLLYIMRNQFLLFFLDSLIQIGVHKIDNQWLFWMASRGHKWLWFVMHSSMKHSFFRSYRLFEQSAIIWNLVQGDSMCFQVAFGVYVYVVSKTQLMRISHIAQSSLSLRL